MMRLFETISVDFFYVIFLNPLMLLLLQVIYLLHFIYLFTLFYVSFTYLCLVGDF